jgi:hypothetical protein
MFYIQSAEDLTTTKAQTIPQPNPLSVHSIKFALLPVVFETNSEHG